MPPRAVAKSTKPGRGAVSKKAKMPTTKSGRVVKLTRFVDEDGDEDMDMAEEDDDDKVDDEDEDEDQEGAMRAAIKAQFAVTKKKQPTARFAIVDQMVKLTRSFPQALDDERTECEEQLTKIMNGLDKAFESDPPLDLDPTVALIGARNNEAQAVQLLHAGVIDDLAVRRDEMLKQTAVMLEAQAKEREKAFKKIMKRARLSLEEGHEYQKAATDATELIKRCKQSLRA